MATRTLKERSFQRLLVLLPPHRTLAGGGSRGQLSASTVVAFFTVDAAGALERGDAPIPLLPKAGQVDLVFDCGDIFCAEAEAPKLSEAKLRQALPNLLEDRLLSEAADCHFAFGTGAPVRGARAAKVPTAVIHRGLLTRALDIFAESGIRPRRAYGDIYTVPAPSDGALCVRLDRGRGVARTGAHEGFAFEFDGSTIPPALSLAVRHGASQRVRAYGKEAPKLASLAPTLGATVEVVNLDLDVAAADNGVNLLQGSFAAASVFPGLPRLSLRSLRAPLIWAGVAAAVFLIGMNAYWLKLEGERKTIRLDMQMAFKAAFPSLDDDPELAVEQARRELRRLKARAGVISNSDFSALNAQIAQMLAIVPIGSVATLEYRDGAMRLKFRPEAGVGADLQNVLRAQAAALGMIVRFDADGGARITVAGG